MAEKTILWQSIKELQAQEQLFLTATDKMSVVRKRNFPIFSKIWLGRTQCQ